jgi:K+ transporter
LFNLAIALAFLPWLPSFLVQIEHRGALAWIPGVNLLSVPMALWQAFSWGAGDGLASFYAIALTLLLVVASIRVILQDTTPARPGVLLMAYTMLPIVGAWLMSLAMPLFMVRYLVFAMLGIAPLLAIALSGLNRGWRAVSIAACLGLETIGLMQMHAHWSRLNGSDEWVDNRLDRVMSQVNAQWRPGDAMLVDGIAWYYTVELLNHTGQVPFILLRNEQGDNTGHAANTYGGATLLYPRSEQLYVADPLAKGWKVQRIWWIASGPVSAGERQLLQGWNRLEEIHEGRSRALLFEPTPSIN